MNLFLYSLKCLSMRLSSLVIPVLQAHPRYLIALALMSTSYVLHPACTVSTRFGIRVISHSQLFFSVLLNAHGTYPSVGHASLMLFLPLSFFRLSPSLSSCLTTPVDQHPLCCELLLLWSVWCWSSQQAVNVRMVLLVAAMWISLVSSTESVLMADCWLLAVSRTCRHCRHCRHCLSYF